MLGAIEEQCAQLADLPTATARHQGDHRGILWQAQLLARGGPISLQRDGIGQRVADETHRYGVLFVEACFEGEQSQHQIAGIANLQHAFLPPGPDRRADVMHGADAGATQLQLDAKIEVRRIDTDEHIGTRVDQGTDQFLAPTQQLRQTAENLDQPHHRQALHGEIGIEPFRLHPRAANADEADVGVPRLERLHQAGTEDVPGRLAGDQGNTERRSHDQRVMPRVALWMESRNTATSGNWADTSASSASASSTVSPWR
ncbi:hypothetical protein D3C78_1061400 [compost metagenome]